MWFFPRIFLSLPVTFFDKLRYSNKSFRVSEKRNANRSSAGHGGPTMRGSHLKTIAQSPFSRILMVNVSFKTLYHEKNHYRHCPILGNWQRRCTMESKQKELQECQRAHACSKESSKKNNTNNGYHRSNQQQLHLGHDDIQLQEPSAILP